MTSRVWRLTPLVFLSMVLQWLDQMIGGENLVVFPLNKLMRPLHWRWTTLCPSSCIFVPRGKSGYPWRSFWHIGWSMVTREFVVYMLKRRFYRAHPRWYSDDRRCPASVYFGRRAAVIQDVRLFWPKGGRSTRRPLIWLQIWVLSIKSKGGVVICILCWSPL
jgi:hypothetical protein